jgi:hypothetical protein
MGKKQMKLTLDCPATYEIKVPGKLDTSWADWDRIINIAIYEEDENHPVTTLTGSMDQAALQGLLRRLYSLGLPLISVDCIDYHPEG